MVDPDSLLLSSASRLLSDKCTERELVQADAGAWPAALWEAVESFGLPLALVGEDQGGFGVPMTEACAVLRLAGGLAVPLPLAETMVANWLLGLTGLEARPGPATVVLGPGLVLDGGRLSGRAERVPWGRSATLVAVLAHKGQTFALRIERDCVTAAPGQNIAHEPRDHVGIDAMLPPHALTPLPGWLSEDGVLAVLAAARCNQLAGAMTRIADISAAYVLQREQFGRPLAKFQAIQQNLAVLASQAAAGRAAAEIAAAAAGGMPVRRLAVAAAKVRTGEAAGVVAGIAHQAHGAMGFSYEYSLHHLTRRLWSWRDEYGNEAYWAAELGRAMAKAGSAGLWPALTDV